MSCGRAPGCETSNKFQIQIQEPVEIINMFRTENETDGWKEVNMHGMLPVPTPGGVHRHMHLYTHIQYTHTPGSMPLVSVFPETVTKTLTHKCKCTNSHTLLPLSRGHVIDLFYWPICTFVDTQDDTGRVHKHTQ